MTPSLLLFFAWIAITAVYTVVGSRVIAALDERSSFGDWEQWLQIVNCLGAAIIGGIVLWNMRFVGVGVMLIPPVVAGVPLLVSENRRRQQRGQQAQLERFVQERRYREAVQLTLKTGNEDDAMRIITRALQWKENFNTVNRAYVDAVDHLFRLRKTAAAARGAGVSAIIIDGIEKETDGTLTTLWPLLDRLSAVQMRGIDSEGIRKRLQGQTLALNAVIQAAKHAESGLGEAMLAGDETAELDTLVMGLRLAGEQAKDYAP